MSLVRSRDTSPEIRVRKLVHGLGYRYRLHSRELPGSPDLVFKSRRKVIFVHGCFWHRHDCPLGTRFPKSNVVFWRRKFAANTVRDRNNYDQLRMDDWSFLVVWECETKRTNLDALGTRITKFLDGH